MTTNPGEVTQESLLEEAIPQEEQTSTEKTQTIEYLPPGLMMRYLSYRD